MQQQNMLEDDNLDLSGIDVDADSITSSKEYEKSKGEDDEYEDSDDEEQKWEDVEESGVDNLFKILLNIKEEHNCRWANLDTDMDSKVVVVPNRSSTRTIYPHNT